MCNRYRVTAKQLEIAQRYGVDPATLFPEPEPLPPPELFPKRIGWVLRNEGGTHRLEAMKWGVPLPPTGKPVTNVRNLASPFWRSMLKTPERRCLVPVTSFCEWSSPPQLADGELPLHHPSGGPPPLQKQGRIRKVEHWFSLPSQPIFSFAGIWRPAPEGNCFAFLTCDPNPLVAPIHEKAMPVILHPDDEERWLDGEVDEICALAAPFPSQLMIVA